MYVNEVIEFVYTPVIVLIQILYILLVFLLTLTNIKMQHETVTLQTKLLLILNTLVSCI